MLLYPELVLTQLAITLIQELVHKILLRKNGRGNKTTHWCAPCGTQSKLQASNEEARTHDACGKHGKHASCLGGTVETHRQCNLKSSEEGKKPRRS